MTGEGNHLPVIQQNQPKGSKTILLVLGGMAMAVGGAAIGMQFMKAAPGQAADQRPTGAAPQTASGPARAPGHLNVLAHVGPKREAVSYDMVAEECVRRYGEEILEDLVNRLIIQQSCEQHGVSVTEEEVTQEISRIAKRFNLDPAAWYRMLQAERNITPSQYRNSVIWPMLALKKLAREEIQVKEEEIQKAFVRNYGPRVKARMIVLSDARRARECWEKVAKDPSTFETCAQIYSIDPNSRALGGTVPPIPRYSGADQMEVAAFKLKPGEVSGVVDTGNGRYAIILCEGRTEQIVTNIDEVRNTLYEELEEQRTQETVAKIFDRLKKDARVDNYLTRTTNVPSRPINDGNQDAEVVPTSGTRTSTSAVPGQVRTGPPNSSNTAGRPAPTRQ